MNYIHKQSGGNRICIPSAPPFPPPLSPPQMFHVSKSIESINENIYPVKNSNSKGRRASGKIAIAFTLHFLF